jgi:hypothetical protein
MESIDNFIELLNVIKELENKIEEAQNMLDI